MLARLVTTKAPPLWSPPAIAAAAVISTLQLGATMPRRPSEPRHHETLEVGLRSPVYLLPLLPRRGQRPRVEHVQWLSVSIPGVVTTAGPGTPVKRRASEAAARVRRPVPEEAPSDDDSRGRVYIVPEVDRAVVRDPSSAAPDYPEYLRQEGIEGLVVVKFVVDTTGLADSASLRVLSTSHPAFAEALRAALPKMKFVPAAIAGRSVRQLVEQQFRFVITKADSTLARAHVRARERS